MPITAFELPERHKYQNGFGSYFEYVYPAVLEIGYDISSTH